jgi:predicted alpha/beta-hydrolase family hydrolase
MGPPAAKVSPAGDPSAPKWRIAVGADATSAVFEPALGLPSGALFVFAHGAGGHMADRGMLALTARLRGGGFGVVRFNFLYREKGRGRPDPMPRLKECIAAVASHARREIAPRALILGGRSMGGRVASMLAADGFPCDGLLLLSYPLHPAGKPEELRDAHLAKIQVPVLCLNGTRDALCQRGLMERVVARLGKGWTMHWLEGADHSFRVLGSSGRSDEQVLDEAGKTCAGWVSTVKQPRQR